MSFHEDELLKIKKATSGFFKKSARKTISDKLSRFKPKIDAAMKLDEDEKIQELTQLMNEATAERQQALREGARNHGHPKWAAAAACESWIQALHPATKGENPARIGQLINELINRT